MWIFSKDGCFSVVKHRSKPDTLIVKSQFKGDLERLFDGLACTITELPTADYRFRAETTPRVLSAIVSSSIRDITYESVKEGIAQPTDHDGGSARREAYLGCFNSIKQAGIDLMWNDDTNQLSED